MTRHPISGAVRNYAAEKQLAELINNLQAIAGALPVPAADAEGDRLRYAPNWKAVDALSSDLLECARAMQALAKAVR